MKNGLNEIEDDIAEAETAQQAIYELLASNLDAALPLVQRPGRATDAAYIADLCERIGYLGQVADRLGQWNAVSRVESR